MPADVTLNSGSGGAIIATDPTTSSEHYQLIKVAQGAVGTFTLVTTANAFPVVIGSSFQGGIVSLSSTPTVTATAATSPWSSAPGFNVPVVSVSSGLVQLSSQITVTATGPVTVTSGLISVTSGTITSTAATNPWSSAPSFNVPTVSVSSGLVQVSAVQVSPTSSVAGAGFLVVTSSFGLVTQSTQPVTVTSGTVTLSSVHTVTATAGTNPWSSAPGFNVPVVSVSSGLVQALQGGTWTLQTTAGTAVAASSAIGVPVYHAVTPTSSVAGAAIAPATSSAGLLANLSSGTVTLSSVHTVTATAATNPWSSAPGFNVPVVSVSSGLVQLTVPTLISLGTTAAAPIAVLVTSSAGPVMSAGVNTAAGYGPVTSSAGRLASLSSGTVTLSSVHTVTATAGTNPWSSAPGFNVPVVNVSSGFIRAFPVGAVTTSGLSAFHRMTTGGAAVSVITTAASSLYGYAIFNSSAVPRTTKFYNSTAPSIGGSTANLILSVQAPGSTGGGGANLTLPMGLYSSNGWSCIITAGMGDTDTGAPGTNDISCGVFYQT